MSMRIDAVIIYFSPKIKYGSANWLEVKCTPVYTVVFTLLLPKSGYTLAIYPQGECTPGCPVIFTSLPHWDIVTMSDPPRLEDRNLIPFDRGRSLFWRQATEEAYVSPSTESQSGPSMRLEQAGLYDAHCRSCCAKCIKVASLVHK